MDHPVDARPGQAEFLFPPGQGFYEKLGLSQAKELETIRMQTRQVARKDLISRLVFDLTPRPCPLDDANAKLSKLTETTQKIGPGPERAVADKRR